VYGNFSKDTIKKIIKLHIVFSCSDIEKLFKEFWSRVKGRPYLLSINKYLIEIRGQGIDPSSDKAEKLVMKKIRSILERASNRGKLGGT
jgi:hypothetical protein